MLHVCNLKKTIIGWWVPTEKYWVVKQSEQKHGTKHVKDNNAVIPMGRKENVTDWKQFV